MRPSIGRKLFARLSLLLALLWFSVIVSVGWVVRYETNEVFDSALQETAERILPLAEAQITAGIKDRAYVSSQHDEYLAYQVVNSKNVVLIQSHDAPHVAYSVPLVKGFYERGNQVFYVQPNDQASLFVILAENPGHRSSTLKDVLIFLGLPLLFLIPGTGLFVFFLIKKAQTTIQELGSQLASRNSIDLAPLDTMALPLELVGLGESINNLMKRLKLALESERNFAANSAHELRTPIAIAMAQIDLLKSELSGEALSRALDARLKLERLEGMTVKLLQLARAEAGVALNLGAVDLVAVVKMIVRDFDFKGKNPIKSNFDPRCPHIIGDVDAIGIVVQNLLENACKHASEGSVIEVSVTADGVFSVMNDCDCIAPDVLETLCQRFARADQTKSGSGIGLAIVDAIIRQCHAKLEMVSPCYSNKRGFKVSVRFCLNSGLKK